MVLGSDYGLRGSRHMVILHWILMIVEAVAFLLSARFWLKSARVPVPVFESTYDQIDQIKPLTQNLASASRWNKWAAIWASVGAIVHVVGYSSHSWKIRHGSEM